MDVDENNHIIFPFHNTDLNPPPITPIPPKFHHFPLLPAELRIKIWILAHPGPRSVVITLGNRSHDHPRPRPSLPHLFVNHESRAIFLECYVRIFRYAESKKLRGRGECSYFNFEKDSLCVASGLKGLKYLLHRFPGVMMRIRYLDVNVDSHAMHAGQLFSLDDCPLQISALPDLRLVTLRRLTFSRNREKHYSFRGDFADTLEVLQKELRHRHARKDCGKEKGVTLAVQCIFSEKGRDFSQFRDLYTILFPLGKVIVERWEQMEDMFVEESGDMLKKKGWGCKSGEIDLHIDWSRTRSSRLN